MNDLASLAAGFVRSAAYRELTLRNLALLSVVADEPGPHTVRGLAKRLQTSKPVITRALNSLYLLVERQPDPADRRNLFVALKPEGRAFRDDLLKLANGNG